MSDQPEKSKTPICDACHLPHPPLVPCMEVMQANMRQLLLRIGTVDHCRGCRATIYWIRHLNGKNAPYTVAGLNHFIDCPNREEFSRR